MIYLLQTTVSLIRLLVDIKMTTNIPDDWKKCETISKVVMTHNIYYSDSTALHLTQGRMRFDFHRSRTTACDLTGTIYCASKYLPWKRKESRANHGLRIPDEKAMSTIKKFEYWNEYFNKLNELLAITLMMWRMGQGINQGTWSFMLLSLWKHGL